MLKISIATILVAASVFAQEADAARRDKRQASQRSRIHQGVKSGELTKGEASKLRKQQRGVNRAERRAESDGVVTDVEKARIEARQDHANKAIYRMKHNKRQRSTSSVDESSGE